MIPSCKDDRHKDKIRWSDDQVNTRAEHKINFPDIIGSPGHHVAYRQQAVIGHTFSQQTGIKFMPDIPFHPLANQLSAEVSTQLQEAPQDLSSSD